MRIFDSMLPIHFISCDKFLQLLNYKIYKTPTIYHIYNCQARQEASCKDRKFTAKPLLAQNDAMLNGAMVENDHDKIIRHMDIRASLALLKARGII